MPSNHLPLCKFNDRFFTIIHGLPFYLSTGNNSGKTGCWFPCFGVKEAPDVERPWVIKPSRSGIRQAMKQDETLYYVSPKTEINDITWSEFPHSQKQSILLLQWQDDTLRARYLSSGNQGVSFVFAKNFPLDTMTSLILPLVFTKKSIVSGQQLSQLVRHDFILFKKEINDFKNDLFALFYQHVYQDTRLATVSHFDPDNHRLEERFINVSLFGISAQLHQSTPQKYTSNDTKDFWESEQVKQLIAQTSRISFPRLNMEHYNTFEKCTEVNQWLKLNGGTVLPNNHPLDVFAKLRAAPFLVYQQMKLGESPLRAKFIVHSLGIQLELVKMHIQLSLFNVNTQHALTLTNSDDNHTFPPRTYQ